MSGSSTGSGVKIPTGYSAPLYEVTDKDHRAWIVITTALCLCWLLLFAAIRVVIRRTISPGFKLDDAILGASTVLAVIQSSIVLRACSDGLGKSADLIAPATLVHVQKLYYTSNIFFILALGLSKLSVVFFLIRITAVKEQRLVFHVVAGLIAAWTLASTFVVALQCNLGHPWIIVGQNCSGAFLRWKVLSAFDIISEVVIVLLAIYLVWGLQTSVSKKMTVVSAFAFRLAIIVAIAFRLANFDKSDRVSNPTLAEAIFIVWTQTELCYSLISATIPGLRAFVANLNTHFGGMGAMQSEYGHGYGSGDAKATYQLSNMRSANKSAALRSVDNGEEHTDLPIQGSASGFDRRPVQYSYGVWTAPTTGVDMVDSNKGMKRNISETGEENPKADASSLGSHDSQRMIIKKDVTWEVHAA